MHRLRLTGIILALGVSCVSSLVARPHAAGSLPPRLRVDSTHRRLETVTGAPFFYLADTGWGLFSSLTSGEITTYVQNRQSKGFTVIQAVLVWDLCAAFRNCDPGSPIQAYWKDIDAKIAHVETAGLYLALLPTWGSPVEQGTLTAATAEALGRFLGNRYKSHPIIWVLGGDTDPRGFEAVWRAEAKGIAIGQTGSETYATTLITFHPRPYDLGGGVTCVSARCAFGSDPWLAFSMLQTGHCLACPPDVGVTDDYAAVPIKPVVVGEAAYEHIPDQLNPANPLITADDVEHAAYEAVFAGAAGYGYGANEVYGFWVPGVTGWGYDLWGASLPWPQAIDLPGAFRMGTLRALLQGRPNRVPDLSLLVSPNPWTLQTHIQVTRATDQTWALVYVPDGRTFTLDTSSLSGASATCRWRSPETGATVFCGTVTAGVQDFTPPTAGLSAVLDLTAN